MKRNIKFLKNIIRTPARYVNIDLHDYKNTIFIAGSGRSGTTWLQQLLNYRNDYRLIFEPFLPIYVDLVKHWNFRQYLRVDNSDPKFITPAEQILSGKIGGEWVNRYNKRLYSTKRIIKDVHANLFLKWMKHNFQEIPIIFILRHPCAVANSKMKVNWQWESKLDYFFQQDELIEDFLLPFEKDIRNTKTEFEKHIFMWCIENFVPLTQFSEGQIFVTFYENIFLNPDKEIANIFSFIDESYSPKIMENFDKPSPTSIKDSAIKTGGNVINSWRNDISRRQIQDAVNILHLFGLDEVYNDYDSPLIKNYEILGKF